MGLRRLRARLDQLQSNANFTMAQAQELISIAKALTDDLQDGVGVTINVDANAAKTLMGLVMGKAGTLPISVQVDPTIDSLPHRICDFEGGSHDGKRYSISDTGNTSITLAGDQGPETFQWDGKKFVYVG